MPKALDSLPSRTVKTLLSDPAVPLSVYTLLSTHNSKVAAGAAMVQTGTALTWHTLLLLWLLVSVSRLFRPSEHPRLLLSVTPMTRGSRLCMLWVLHKHLMYEDQTPSSERSQQKGGSWKGLASRMLDYHGPQVMCESGHRGPARQCKLPSPPGIPCGSWDKSTRRMLFVY